MEALKVLDAEDVTLYSLSKGQSKLTAGKVKITLEGFEAKDFPPVPKVVGKSIQIEELASALGKVSFSASTDDCRPVLTGICLIPGKGKVELAAADGFQLAVTTAKSKGVLPKQVILPPEAVRLIKKLMPGTLRVVSGDGGNISFEGEGLVLVAKPIGGTFPRYQQLIPKLGRKLTVDSEELRKALKVLAAIKPDSGIVRFESNGSRLKLSARNEEFGTSEARIPSKGKFKSAFDLKLLNRMLTRVDGEITMDTKSVSSPMSMRRKNWTCVTMPMFVQW